VLLPFASALKDADARMSARVTEDHIRRIIALVPDTWLAERSAFETPELNRQAYIEYLLRRLASPHAFVEEALRARSLLV
jgi:hypothetical protein